MDVIGAGVTHWFHRRAKDGHKFVLVEVKYGHNGVWASGIMAQIYDGHKYSQWGSFPDIFDQDTLALVHLNLYITAHSESLNFWECKEYTISFRNIGSVEHKPTAIIYYYEVPMTIFEKFMYAVIHPKRKLRKGSATTLTEGESTA